MDDPLPVKAPLLRFDKRVTLREPRASLTSAGLRCYLHDQRKIRESVRTLPFAFGKTAVAPRNYMI